MNRKSKYFLVDSTLLGFSLISAASGILLWSVFKRGSGWRETRWFLKDVHKWSGLVVSGTAAYHIYLHWNWLINTGRSLLRIDNGQSRK